MAQPTQAVQRVCPHCARVSYETAPTCPYCGRGFRRRSILPGLAALLAVFAVVILGGLYLMLVAAGDELDRRLDREVSRVERDIDRNFDRIQEDVREELDRRLPATPTAVP